MSVGKNENEHIRNILQYQTISKKIKNLLQDSTRIADALKKLRTVHTVAKGKYDVSIHHLITGEVLPKIDKNKEILGQVYSILKKYCTRVLPSKTPSDKRQIEQILGTLVPLATESIKGSLFFEGLPESQEVDCPSCRLRVGQTPRRLSGFTNSPIQEVLRGPTEKSPWTGGRKKRRKNCTRRKSERRSVRRRAKNRSKKAKRK